MIIYAYALFYSTYETIIITICINCEKVNKGFEMAQTEKPGGPAEGKKTFLMKESDREAELRNFIDNLIQLHRVQGSVLNRLESRILRREQDLGDS